MVTVDLKSPEFRVLCHKNVLILERTTFNLCREGWYPVGGVGRKGNDWVQVMMRERQDLKKCYNVTLADQEALDGLGVGVVAELGDGRRFERRDGRIVEITEEKEKEVSRSQVLHSLNEQMVIRDKRE